jgi:allantoate deiminase
VIPTAAEFRPAQRVIDACQTIAGFSESPNGITRTYLSPPVREIHRFLRDWMDRLGMESSVDAVGNLRGVFRCGQPDAPRLLSGSHIDTVPNAGAYDGVLGVVMALTLIEELSAPDNGSIDYDIEFVAFAEEESVRFPVPFLGSRAITGELDADALAQTDAKGATLAEAIESFGLNPSQVSDAVLHESTKAFIEFHIEQGPVLEDLDLSLGIVEAIAGQSRYELTFRGKANHAGTSPMHLRRDALAGAARWITFVERKARQTPGLVATVGRIEAGPGAANVVPGEVRLTLDIRHATDSVRLTALAGLLQTAGQIATLRGLGLEIVQQFTEPATPMNAALAAGLAAAAEATGSQTHRMVSGAGHDAMVLARKVPAAMLFLRSPAGVSHHPDESVRLEDVQAALDAGLYFFQHLDAAALLSLEQSR